MAVHPFPPDAVRERCCCCSSGRLRAGERGARARHRRARRRASATREAPDQPARGCGSRPRGSSSSPTARRRTRSGRSSRAGITDARRQTGAAVSYRAPDRFSIDRMRRFIDEAVADHPDGLVVWLPDVRGARGRRSATRSRAGIPTITINCGSDEFKSLGVLAHVGQPELRAGRRERRAAGPRRACGARCASTRSPATSGLDERCRGFADGLREYGGSVASRCSVPLQNPAIAQRRMAAAIASEPVDGILTLGPGGATPAIAAVRASGLQSRITLATFDLSARRAGGGARRQDALRGRPAAVPAGLSAGDAAGRAGKRHGSSRAQGELIPTGPQFVTKADARGGDPAQRRGDPLIGATVALVRRWRSLRRELDLEAAAAAADVDRACARARWSSSTVGSGLRWPSGLMPPAT